VTALTRCPEGGWVVARSLVPDDPADHWTRGVGDVVGCNRLVCPRCESAVRSVPNLRPKPRSLKPHLAEMADTDDWSTLEYIEATHGSRLYACRCFAHHATSRYLAQDRDPDARGDIRFPWSCGGHPAPSLPLTVDGVTIDADTDPADLVRRALDEGAPLEAQIGWREYPASWLGRLYYRLRGLPQATALALAVGDRLLSERPQDVGDALGFYGIWPTAPGSDGVLALADRVGAARIFGARYIDRTTPQSAGATLLAGVARGAAVAPEVLHHLEALALTTGNGGLKRAGLVHLLEVLAGHDPDFLAREAVLIADGDPRRGGEILRALRKSGRTELVVVAGTALLGAGGFDDAVRRFVRSTYARGQPWAFVLERALASRA